MRIVEKSSVLVLALCILTACQQRPLKHDRKAAKNKTVDYRVEHDFTGDGTMDGVVMTATRQQVGYKIQIILRYDEGKSRTVQVLHLSDGENILQWGLEASDNWISVGYSDGKVGSFYDLCYNAAERQFQLRNAVRIRFGAEVKATYALLGEGSLEVSQDAMEVCRTPMDLKLPDTLRFVMSPRSACEKVVYDSGSRERTIGGVFSILGLPSLHEVK